MRITIWLLFVIACNRSEPTTHEPEARQPATTARPADWIELDMAQPIAPAIAEQARAAIAAGKKPHLYLHATWCPPCVEIEKTRHDPRMVKAFTGTHIIAVDTDREDAQLIPLGFHTTVIPVFYRLDAEGHPTGDKITGGAWGEDTPASMAPPLEAFFSR